MRCAVVIISLLACLALPALTQSRPRIYIGSLEYRGPWVPSGSAILVDLKAFTQAMGWVMHEQGAAVCVASHAPCSLPDGATGVWLGGKPFAGLVRREKDVLLVSLDDVAKALGGTVRTDSELQIVQATIPGMPGPLASDPAEVLKGQVESKPFTLVCFLLDSDPYCERLKPHIRTFGSHHEAVLRVVEVNLENPGPNWIYGNYKTPDNGVPEMVLVNSRGRVLQKLLGETDAKGLEKELAGFLKKP